MPNVMQEAVNTNFIVFGLIRLGIEPNLTTVALADALSILALNGKISSEKKHSRNVDSAKSTTKHQIETIRFWPPHKPNRMLQKLNF